MTGRRAATGASGPRLGVVADDVTGACDLADAVRDAGGSAVVVLGVPGRDLDLPSCDCAVVALRTRTAPRPQAVAESVASARRLLDLGAQALYQKYCSTFDSTDDGMIGPVADALLDLLGPDAVAVGTPATPRAGRTQYQGHLFVGDRLLSESPLRDHPLTPMRDPDLVRVLGRQTPRPVALLSRQAVLSDDAAAALERLAADGARHVLADALTDADLDALAEVLAGRRAAPGRPVLLGGAAGLAAALARLWARATPASPSVRTSAGAPGLPPAAGARADRRALVVSGSCSARTLEQIARFDGPRIALDATALAADREVALDGVLRALADAYRAGPGPVLVASSAEPAAVRATQGRLGARRAAALLEDAAGEVAARAVRDLGVGRLLVAGGETSGAVATALGLHVLHVGPAAAPGVPWMVPVGRPGLSVLLKSGNFGGPDLFRTAWEACP
ncbi:3-oxo-tetronate kinase [Cellulomonas sp. C5510]|uniref:3-oxo-tetronate kinase n=1 Tax=Cellulomonas sp. C5510 TaxID=2871170 RepID=UPI001C9589BA|nr:3-oxo-tetronate kinase [Cellulomonas sp. C5510]QZN85499.1 four-carbon acid sugar kinase family protein [Cellulomonas sp. C5510]